MGHGISSGSILSVYFSARCLGAEDNNGSQGNGEPGFSKPRREDIPIIEGTSMFSLDAWRFVSTRECNGKCVSRYLVGEYDVFGEKTRAYTIDEKRVGNMGWTPFVFPGPTETF